MTIQYKIVRFNTGKYGVQVSGEDIKQDKEYYLHEGTSGYISHSAAFCLERFNESLQKDNIHLCKDQIERHKKQLEEAKLFVEQVIEIVE